MFAKKLNPKYNYNFFHILKNNVLYLSKSSIFYPWNNKPFQWSIKRIIDLTISFWGLLLLSPLWLLIIILIKLDSNGPVLYSQKRIGFNKKLFNMYKFRSMKENSEKELKNLSSQNETNSIMFKLNNDPRATKIGKFLRKYSIDEFPQLINVLKGEMSLVGPRPPLPKEVEKYDEWHFVRFLTLPGLTGNWQVNGRSKIKNFNEVVDLDFQYIKNWSLLKDFIILLKTIPIVLLGKE